MDQLQNEFDVGLKGSLICTKVFGKIMAKKKIGSIVNVSSDLGIIAPNQSIYNKSNQFLKMLNLFLIQLLNLVLLV